MREPTTFVLSRLRPCLEAFQQAQVKSRMGALEPGSWAKQADELRAVVEDRFKRLVEEYDLSQDDEDYVRRMMAGWGL